MGVIKGTDGNDFLAGTSADDVILGGAGNDTLSSSNYIYGGGGNDSLDGGDGNDVLYGALEQGDITLSGGNGDDYFDLQDSAFTPAHTLLADGGDGNDTFQVQFTNPLSQISLHGGGGSDTYRFWFYSAAQLTNLTITDFVAGAGGDRLDVDRLVNNDVNAGGPGGNPFAGDKPLLRLVQQDSDTLVQFLVNDGKSAGYQTVATLKNVDAVTLTADNFVHGLSPDGTQSGGVNLVGNDSPNVLKGGDYFDTLSGGAADDILDGGGGADLLDGRVGNDSLIGGCGNDTLLGGAGNDTLVGGPGLDYATPSGSDSLVGGTGNDVLCAKFDGGHSTLLGGDGNDTFTLVGDSLGDLGAMTLDGGAGDDVVNIRVSLPSQTALLASGGDGVDTYILLWLANGVFINNLVETGIVITDFKAGAGGDRIDVMELVRDATMNGARGGNPFSSADGVLKLVQDGLDTLLQYDYTGGRYGPAFITLTRLRDVDSTTLTVDNFVGGLAPDGSKIPGVVLQAGANGGSLTDGIFDDTLLGGQGSDTLSSGGGDDSLSGGAGNDVLLAYRGSDTLRGEAGNDTLSAGNDGAYLDGGDGNDVLTISGNIVGASTLTGGAGDDTLNINKNDSSAYIGTADGGDGNDVFNLTPATGGQLHLTAHGGAGVDTYVLGHWYAGGVQISDFAAEDQIDLRPFLSGIVYVTDPGGNPFAAKVGLLRLTQDGADTLLQVRSDGIYHTVLTLKDVDAGTLTDANFVGGFHLDGSAMPGVAMSIASAYSQLGGTVYNDTLTANGDYEDLEGWGGDDLLQAGPNVQQRLLLQGGGGDDTLIGGGGSDFLIGDDGNDVFVISAGRDGIEGGPGFNILQGMGKFADYQIVRTGKFSLAVTDKAGNTTSTNNVALFKFSDVSKTFQELFYNRPSDWDDELHGTSGNDTLSGGSGNDLLDGGAGDDSLQGGADNDTIVAGGGKDKVDGGDGNDVLAGLGQFADYTVTRVSATDTLLSDTHGNSIMLRNVETLSFADGDRTIASLLDNVPSSGNDSLHGTPGNDTISGAAGADTMAGGAGNDIYLVDNVGDIIVENTGEGLDTAQFTTAGTYTLAANVENGTAMGTVAINIVGNELDNILTGNSAVNTLTGGAGNDTLIGGAGADKLIGGTGDDVYVVTDASNTITEALNEGNDTVKTTLASYTLGANVENLTYTGTAAFTGTGNALDNIIIGGNGGNKLDGGAGNDQLTGGAGADSLIGGAGDDTFIATGGKDTIDGGDGSDQLQLHGNVADYTVTRPNTTDTLLTDKDGNVITVRNVESFMFADNTITLSDLQYNIVSPGNDVIHARGTSDPETLDGGLGADTMIGGSGDDTFMVDNVGDTIVAQPGWNHDTALVSIATAGATYTLGDYVEAGVITSKAAINLTGNDQDNTLTGNAAANTLTGGGGNDTLIGGGGADKLIGGTGDDLYIVSDASVTITEKASEGLDTVKTSLSTYSLPANVEILQYTGTAFFTATGSAQSDIIYGGDAGNKIDGGAGNDLLNGGKGNDSLSGGAGDDVFIVGGGQDTIDGGDGDDTIWNMGNRSDYTITRPNATDTVLTDKAGNVLTVRNVEHFYFVSDLETLADIQLNIASVGNDRMVGTVDNDTLDGGAGADTMVGGQGDDIYIVDNVGDVIDETGGTGTDTAKVGITTAGATYKLADGVEIGVITSAVAVNLTGNDLDNTLTGNAAANTLTGGAGNDTLDGGAGADKLIGGIGDDTYIVDNAGDVVTEQPGEGFDTVQTALSSYTLTANVEKLVYTGVGAFTGVGNAQDNYLFGSSTAANKLDGGGGNDSLVGGAGNDGLVGGTGDDTIYAGTGKDTIDGGDGIDTLTGLHYFSDYTITRPNATDVVLTDHSGNVLTVHGVENFRFGDGDKTWSEVVYNIRSVGNDALFGTGDNDTMDGGAGADTMTGYSGDDTYVIENVGDRIVEDINGGTDTALVGLGTAGTYALDANVENATVTSAASVAVNLTGNDLNNHLTGNGAANTLTGGAGDDTLDGGAGADKLIGGTGDDTYIVDNSGDVVTEQVGEGTDTVQTTLATYTLPANVERLVYTGTGSLTGTGNVLDNEIHGGDHGAKLDGGAGNDTLYGGLGNDSLQGGTGNDYLFGAGGNDTVDGGQGYDILSGLGKLADYTITRPNSTDVVLTDHAGHAITVRNVEGFEFADGVLSLSEATYNTASTGNDNLFGTDGSDTINGLAGADTMSGGLGDDTYIIDNVGDRIVEASNGGTDLALVGFTAAGTYTLDANVENATVTSAATVAVNLTGNDLDNHLTGNAAANTLIGGAGNDTLDGGAGADKLIGGTGDDVYSVDNAGDVVIEQPNEGVDVVQTTLASYTLTANMENLTYVGAASFSGTGNAQDNLIMGGDHGAKLDGGAGNDTLFGGAGNDSIQGGVGDDAIVVGSGVDTVDGGAGSDTLFLSGAQTDYTVTRINGTDTVLADNHGNAVTLRNIEAVSFGGTLVTTDALLHNMASSGNDHLYGYTSDDVLNGGAGVDTLEGGAGDDTYVISNVASVVVENPGEGNDTVQLAVTTAGATYTLTANVENAVVTSTVAANLTGNELDNHLVGNTAANILIGGAGNDTLVGGGGADKLIGGAGDDVYVVTDSAAVVTELAGEGTDFVDTNLASYTLTANVEGLVYYGSGFFTGTGNGENNLIVAGNGGSKLDGGAGDDLLVGGNGNDSMQGGLGDDMFMTGHGKDTVDGGAGTNVLSSLDYFANYTINRPNATDIVLTHYTGDVIVVRNVQYFEFADGEMTLAQVQVNSATTGNDVLMGTQYNDTLDGGLGNDTMRGGDGNDIYVLSAPGDVVIEAPGEGSDTVQLAFTAAGTYTVAANVEKAVVTAASTVAVNVVANDLGDSLIGNGAANNLAGGAGNDTIDGGAGNDTMAGGKGDDTYVVADAGDLVKENANEGQDIVFTTLANYTLSANVEDLVFQGTGAFTGTGNGGDNRLFAGSSSGAKLDGGAGNDLLVGGAGNDSLIGGAGDDLFQASTGKDTVDGGDGFDVLYGLGSFYNYTITRPNATDTVLTDNQGHSFTVRNVEYFYFDEGGLSLAQLQNNTASNGNDNIVGTSGADVLDGGAGADTMTGGLGDDIYVVDNAGDVIVEDVNGGHDQVKVMLTAGVYAMAANLEDATIASTAAVGVTGNGLDNRITGNAAANKLIGGAGNDTLDGGAGNDTLVGGTGDDVYLVTDAGDVVTEQANEGHDVVRTSLATYTLGANIEDLVYTGTAAFTATGNVLDNLITGGNAGNKLDGGAGNDTLVGGNGNDSILGGLGDDVIVASAGIDTIDGGAGNDTVIHLGAFADYVIARPNGTDLTLTDHGGNTMLLHNVEWLQFSDGTVATAGLQDNVATTGNDDLHGTGGNDVINGLAGADTMAGGAGNDTYVVDRADDVVVEHPGEGMDLVNVAFAAAGTYVLAADVENATVTSASSIAVNLTGNELDNVLTGNGASNVLIGGAGNDTLDGGAGSDNMLGGTGDDVYKVDAAGDKVIELSNEGIDRVDTSLASYSLSANVENLRYTGSAAFSGTGNELANTIEGGIGNDTLSGGAGDDVLVGGAGSDKLTGGTGADSFVLNSLKGMDTVTDFVSGADHVQISLGGIAAIGDGNFNLDNAAVRAVSGGFSSSAELVIFTQRMATESAANAAAVIGTADAAYADGQTALFAVSTGTATTLYLFKSAGNDALVSANELTELVTLTGTPTTTVADYQLVA